MAVVGGARFPGKITPPERHRFGSRTGAHDIAQQCRHDEGVARVDRLFGILASNDGRFLKNDLTLGIDDFRDEVRLDAEATVGEYGVSARHLQRIGLSSTQRERQVGRMLLGIKAELADVVLRIARPDGAQDADRHHVF